MNPEMKTEWIERLRSGNYKQGRSMLNAEDQFCCLGVLCEIALDYGLVTKEEIVSLSRYKYISTRNSTDTEESTLPRVVAGIANITREAENDLIDLNDVEQKNFNEIADWIEVNL